MTNRRSQFALTVCDRPLAAAGLTSYRYQGRYGWIMIGARDNADALREAARSTDDKIVIEKLQRWTGQSYQPVCPAMA